MQPAKTIQTAVTDAVRGDVDARAWLYQQYAKAMFNICIRMAGNRSDAEDILQEAFILAFKNIHQLKEAEGFSGWLKRIVINECIRHSKKTFYWDDWDEHDKEIADEQLTEWWSSISLEMLHTAIKKLPEGCRQVFVLFAMEDFTHKDIAAEMGISESTSKSQYQRARQLLQQRITTQAAIWMN